MESQIVPQTKQIDMFIYAKNSVEMVEAQKNIIEGMKAKLAKEKQAKADLELNLEIAKKNKWRTETLKRHVGYAQNRVEFYEKVVAALEAGYQIVPEMDVEVFAVRTRAKKPRANTKTGENRWQGPSLKDQNADHGPVGEGRYVSPDQGTINDRPFEGPPAKEGEKPTQMVTRSWLEFGDPEFPFQLVKPQILDMTSQAMKKLIFDEMGILPRTRKADPVVIGRITLKGTSRWQRKSVNFMVAWFVDLDDL